MNEKADRRLERRALLLEDIERLLAAALDGGVVQGMTGYERSLLYRLAIETGLRSSEIYHLTRGAFDFTKETATVTIEAKYAKNRKKATLPLRPDLAQDMKDDLVLHLPAARVFTNMQKGRGAAMLRVDLEAVGIPYFDEYDRVADFHALRHSFASLLNQAGVPLVTAQQLMWHSDPRLTANIYTHVMVEGKAEALEKLPAIHAMPDTESEHMRTGTDDVLNFVQGEIRDTHRDTRKANFNGLIRTYTNAETEAQAMDCPFPETQKNPENQGFSGINGGEGGIRTLDTGYPI